MPEPLLSVFIIPREWVKNGEDRLVVLNGVARSVVEGEGGKHPTHVFTYRGHPVTKMYNGAWKRDRFKIGLPMVRIHDLKHTYGRGLRAAGVPLETRKVLLGHKSGDITTHYSGPELEELMQASNRVYGGESRKGPALVVLRKRMTSAARGKAFRFNE